MKTAMLREDLIAEIEKLPYELQLRVLDFTKSLVPKGAKGKDLLRFEGIISDDDLHTMSDAIEDGCDRVDAGEW